MPGPEVVTCSSRPKGPPVVYENMTNTNEKMPAFFATDFSVRLSASATGKKKLQWRDATRFCPRAQHRSKANLKFSRVFLRPALDNYLFVGVKLDRIAPLAVHVTEEAVLPSAEREVCHWCRDSNVDANIPCGRLITKAARGGTARRE